MVADRRMAGECLARGMRQITVTLLALPLVRIAASDFGVDTIDVQKCTRLCGCREFDYDSGSLIAGMSIRRFHEN